MAAAPDGTWLEIEQTALAIGLASGRHKTSVFERTLDRLIRFRVADIRDPYTVAVRDHLAPLNARQRERLPRDLQIEHQRWLDQSPSRRNRPITV